MSNQAVLEFYQQQSCFSNPATYTQLFDDLPDDLDQLCRIVRGVYVHYRSNIVANTLEQRVGEIDTRYISRILEQIITLDNNALTVHRPVDKRFIGCCRDASLLLCSILRHKGIPARIRVGFATYIQIDSPFPYVDHVVTEIWDTDIQRWKMVDAEQDDTNIKNNNITFDVHDIPHDKFLVGGRAWQIGRNNADRWNDFGVNDFVKGRWFVAGYLMRDFAALNRHELLLWDTWGLMNNFDDLTDEDLELLDTIADLTLSDNRSFDEVRSLYQSDSRLTLVNTITNYSPVAKPKEEIITCGDNA